MAAATSVRLPSVLTAVVGAVLAAAPAQVAELVAADAAHHPDPRVVRVLGARQLAQGVVTAARPRPALLRAGAATDVLHALSMVGLARLAPAYRRPALLSAGVAAVSALGAVRSARGARRA